MTSEQSSRPRLAVVLGTYNRLDLLKDCINSVLATTGDDTEIHVTDAGSSDGTVEYLQDLQNPRVIPHLVGKKIGQAKALNDVFRQLKTEMVCWISDDNAVLPGALNEAADILERNPAIGMVALKVKDVEGPFVAAPYIGGFSEIGILNVNQGMLPTVLLQELGGFAEEFRDYGIDPDLTARVLFSGKKVVYTKKVAIHHRRQWATDEDPEAKRVLQEKQARSLALYRKKYSGKLSASWMWDFKRWLWSKWEPKLIDRMKRNEPGADVRHRDWGNILRGRYISILDRWTARSEAFHLTQSFRG